VVRSDGTLRFTPKVTHVGVWRVAVRLWTDGQWDRRGGFELVVKASTGVVKVAPKPAPALLTMSPSVTVTDSLQGCDLGLGMAAGVTDVSANWAFLNQSVQASASPIVSFSCQDGKSGGYWWFAGMDSAPGFVIYNDERRFRHTLVGTIGVGLGTHTLRAGPYASIGFVLIGAGARVVWTPFEKKSGLRHGFDMRATVFAQEQFAAQISLMYTMDLGEVWLD